MARPCWIATTRRVVNELPSFVVKGSIATRTYDGTGDDLLKYKSDIYIPAATIADTAPGSRR